MKRYILSAVLLAATVPAMAQRLSPEVIATTGGYRATNGIQISWTLGEIATTTLVGGGTILTQGFHQPLESSVSSVFVSPSVATTRAMIYPNPARDVLFVESVGGTSRTMRVELAGLLGDRRLEVEGEGEVRIDIDDLPSGTYLVRMHRAEEDRPETHLVTIRR